MATLEKGEESSVEIEETNESPTSEFPESFACDYSDIVAHLSCATSALQIDLNLPSPSTHSHSGETGSSRKYGAIGENIQMSNLNPANSDNGENDDGNTTSKNRKGSSKNRYGSGRDENYDNDENDDDDDDDEEGNGHLECPQCPSDDPEVFSDQEALTEHLQLYHGWYD